MLSKSSAGLKKHSGTDHHVEISPHSQCCTTETNLGFEDSSELVDGWLYVDVFNKLDDKTSTSDSKTDHLTDTTMATDSVPTSHLHASHSQLSFESDQDRKTWLDDLPVDKEHSGVGFAYNQEYKDDGYKHQYHEFEDKCLRFKVSENCYLYGVFDGHSGTRASEFVSQWLPAEILLGQLDSVTSDDEIQQILRQAYKTVEKFYFDSLGELIAERTSLQREIEGCKTATMRPELVERLRVVDNELCSGTSALVALIFNGKMYISNIGNSRALLCRTENGKLRVEKLNVDHTLRNEDEVERLHQLGFPKEQLVNSTRFGQQLYTRCIGDYSVKGGYKDNEQMSCAVSEPVIAIPDLENPITLDESCNFLLLMSDGVYRSLFDATETEHVNGDIAGIVAAEFPRQSTLNGVGQAAIDKITRTHHDAFALALPGDSRHSKCSSRDDMTLLIRNFNYSLKAHNVEKVPSSLPLPANHQSESSESTPTDTVDAPIDRYNITTNPFFAQLKYSLDSHNLDSNPDSIADSLKSTGSTSALELDADGRLEPYVSFKDFDAALEAMSDRERQKFEQSLVPKMDCEPIIEHPE